MADEPKVVLPGDANAEPAQTGDTGNPAPLANPAKEPAKEPEKKEVVAEPAKEPEAKVEDEAPLNTEVWGSTGSENGDAVLSLLQNSGVTTDEAKALMFDAIQSGDVTKIDKAALEAKVGKAKAAIILTGADNFVKEQASKANAIVASLHETVGGKDNWKQVADWSKDNIAEEELDVFRGMINAGGLQAKMAAKEMKGLYEAAADNSTLQKTEVLPGAKPKDTAQAPLTAVQYSDALEKLHKEHRGNPPTHLRQALLDARNRGKAARI